MAIYADKILYNGKIYTIDASLNVFSAMAIADGKIIELAAKENESLLIERY
jgi:predicted amidohydrolase YtcJ